MKKQLGNIIFGTNLEWKRLDEVEFLELKYDLMDSSEHWEALSNIVCMFAMKNEHEFMSKMKFTTPQIYVSFELLNSRERELLTHVLAQEIDENMLFLEDYTIFKERCELFKVLYEGKIHYNELKNKDEASQGKIQPEISEDKAFNIGLMTILSIGAIIATCFYCL